MKNHLFLNSKIKKNKKYEYFYTTKTKNSATFLKVTQKIKRIAFDKNSNALISRVFKGSKMEAILTCRWNFVKEFSDNNEIEKKWRIHGFGDEAAIVHNKNGINKRLWNEKKGGKN